MTTVHAPPDARSRVRRRVRVRGVVQGVGFRPFVYRIATEEHVDGFVGNDPAGVFAEVEGAPAAVERLLHRLRADPPPLARVDAVEWDDVAATGAPGFQIVASRRHESGVTFVPPDAAVCDECLRELFDPRDRRYRYPFLNCTNCGPRFTIATALPYDRANTTMAGFTLCSACRREYEDPGNRRHHAEPLACAVCGPQLRFVDAAGLTTGGDDALAATQRALRHGQIVAVKGIGGYHLACNAADDRAVATLRARKRRPDKPLAVMTRDLDRARRLAELDHEEEALLTSVARPIVLVRRRADAGVSPAVAPGTPLLGVMLPYTPLHHLLLAPVPGAATAPLDVLVMTSGNLSDEPICYDDADARTRLAGIVDAWLVHDRPIHVPCDDSVVRTIGHADQPVRRSRGHSPAPLVLPVETRPLLAVGGDVKNAFCLAAGRAAWMSQHLGDMGHVDTLLAFERATDQFRELYGFTPERFVADLHPGYVTRQWAERHDASVVGVQHHHAHATSLMTEHELPRDATILAFAFDGTGFGADGTVWGGEALLTTYAAARRVAHLRVVDLPGGDAGVRAPARLALAHLRAAGVPWSDDLEPVRALKPAVRQVLDAELARGVGCVRSSSAGRLFDAVSSLLGICHSASYEGQAAVELEATATRATGDGPPFAFAVAGGVVDPTPVLHALTHARRRGHPIDELARGFHRAVADAIATQAEQLSATTAIRTVGLTGGVFQNALLTRFTRQRLAARGFEVLVHRRVPPNDGGLALGQAAVAAALARETAA